MSGPEIEEASYSFSERFLLVVCQYQVYLYMALVLESMLLFLAILALFFADLNQASAIVLFMDFVLLGVVMALTVAGLVVCNRR
jgi:hypothetical protein